MHRPWQSNEEMLVDIALESAIAGPEQIRSIQNRELFPERSGYAKTVHTVESVLNVDRFVPTNRSWLSGMPVRPTTMSDQSWSGSARNAMSESPF